MNFPSGRLFGYHWVELDTDLCEIGLEKRTYRFLRKHKIYVVRDLIARRPELQALADKTFGVGPKTFQDAEDAAAELSIKFGPGITAVLQVMSS